MMKKVLFIILSVFTFTSGVYAFEVGDTGTVSETGSNSRYKFTIDGTYYNTFCLDYLTSFSNSYKIEDEVGDRSSIVLVNAYDQAVLAMMKATNFVTDITDAEYYALTLATRVLTSIVSFDSVSESINAKFVNLGVSWYTNSSNSTLTEQIDAIRSNSSLSTSQQDLILIESISGYGTQSSSYSDRALELYKIGIEAMYNYLFYGTEVLDTESASATIKTTSSVSSLIDGITNTSLKAKISSDDYVVDLVTITPVDYDNKVTIKLDFEVTSGDLDFVCYFEYNDGSGAFKSCSENSLDYLQISDSYGTYYITNIYIYVIGENKEEEICSGSSYEVGYTIYDDRIYGTVYKIVSTSTNTSKSYQRFFFYTEAGEFSDSKTGTVDNCGSCEPDYSLVSDCYDIEGGSLVNTYNEFYYESNTNLLACTIGASDEAGNSYEAEYCEYDTGVENGMEGIKTDDFDNPYCSVYCSETYEKIEYPGVQNVNSGGYFKINAVLEGTKTCVTSDIDYSQYVTDIKNAQEDMVDAYNDYLKYYEADITSESGTDSCCGNSKSITKYYLGKGDTYTHITLYLDNSTGQYLSKTEKSTSTVSGSDSDNYSSDTSCASEANPDCCSCDFDPADVDSLREKRTDGYEEAEDKLQEAQQAYEDAITNLLSCVGGINNIAYSVDGWDMEFEVIPEIEYWYDESIYNKITYDTDKYMEVVSNENDSTEYYYCYALDDEGNCVDINGAYSKTDYSDYTTTAQYYYCTTSGCSVKTYSNFPTEELNYVVESIDKEIEYDTPEVFYQSSYTGVEVYSNSDISSTKYIKVNGLPVSKYTKTGAYEFSYTITSWGEYYDDCTGGRINEEIDAMDNSDITADSDSFIYACKYRVNYPDDDCPECNVDTDSEWPDDSYTCTSCLIDGTFQMFFRSITTSSSDNFNANDKDLGYNWNYSYVNTDTIYNFIAGKAEYTVDYIYDISVTSSDAVLTVTLDSSLANKIKDQVESSDYTYTTNTLDCYDYVDSSGNVIYENIFCYSSLLTDWIKNEGDKFVLDGDTIEDRNVGDISSSSIASNDYWTIYVEEIMEITQYSIGGPSWQ